MRGCSVAICVVEFDLVHGQRIKHCTPGDSLTEREKNDIIYHAFPDSKSLELLCHKSVRDTLFHFRLRRDRDDQDNPFLAELARQHSQSPIKTPRKGGPGGAASSSPFAPGEPSTPDALSAGSFTQGSPPLAFSFAEFKAKRSWLYAYGFCRQRQDKSLPRGGEQVSVVVLMDKPYMSILQQITRIAGQLYFDNGEVVLAQVLRSVEGWTSLKPGSHSLCIEALGQRLPISVPERDVEAELASGKEQLLDKWILNYQDSYLWSVYSRPCTFSALHGVIRHLWHLWECMLVAEPVLVFGGSPEAVSSAVAAVVDLTHPLPYSADFRPYFTIQDKEFQHMANPQKAKRAGMPLAIGVTNTYFLKAFSRWPNVLAIGGGEPPLSDSVGSAGGGGGSASGSGRQSSSSLSSTSGGGLWGRLMSPFRSGEQNGAFDDLVALVDGQTQDLWTRHKVRVGISQRTLGSLEHVHDGMTETKWSQVAAANSKVLRRHFAHLTESFLSVFEVYFKPKDTAGKAKCGYASGLVDPSEFPAFHKKEFLKRLAKMQVKREVKDVFCDKAKLLDLYDSFVCSVNFMPWFHNRQLVAKRAARQAWSARRAELDLKPLLAKLTRFELADVFEVTEKQLLVELDDLEGDKKLVGRLRRDIEEIFTALPQDLQQSIMLNPQQAKLLKDCFVDPEVLRRHTAPDEVGSLFSASPLRWFRKLGAARNENEAEHMRRESIL